MIPETDLILNPNNTIYHLHLGADEIPDWIITVGDPERVPKVTKYFDKIFLKRKHRQFHSHLGELGGKQILVISTGIGTDNIDIIINEIDALANIDLTNRKAKKNLRSLNFIRIGTSGAIQKDIPLDSILISDFAIGIDPLMQFYKSKRKSVPVGIIKKASIELSEILHFSYWSKADHQLISKMGDGFLHGITITSPGFYGPQGRSLRLKANGFDIYSLSQIKYQKLQITNIEMETAGIYAMANALGHKAISVNAILANRISGQFSKQPGKTVDLCIKKVLSLL